MMSKEFFIAAHDELIGEYLDQHPEATEAEDYERTADAAYTRMTDRFAALADHFRQLEKDRMI